MLRVRRNKEVRLALLLLTCMMVGCSMFDPPKEWEGVQKGMTEQQVEDLLGSPEHALLASSAPKDYYLKSYSYEKRKITHKVWMYTVLEWALYVYFGKDGKVEHTYIGGS